MRLTHWMMLIGQLVGLGCLQVAQRNAIILKGYAVGERLTRIHRQEAEVSWLNMQVIGLTSPTHLSKITKERQLNFVARMTLPSETATAAARPALRLASVNPEQESSSDDTSD